MTQRNTPLGNIPPTLDPSLRRLLEQVKENLEAGDGVRGDPLRRRITVADLLSLGMVRLDGSIIGTAVAGPLNPGVFIPVAPGSGSEADSRAIPPKPDWLNVTPGFSNVFLQWAPPIYAYHGLTEIHRAPTNNLSDAVLVGTSAHSLYADPVEPGQTWYYWVRFISSANPPVAGPFNSVDGVEAITAQDPAVLLDLLTEQVTESQLHADLTSRIGLIDADETVLGSVAQRLAAEAQARGSAIATEQQARSDADEALASAVEGVQAALPGKADATAVTALDARVDQTEEDITAQATSITQLEASRTGVNLIPAEYATAHSLTAPPPMRVSANGTLDLSPGSWKPDGSAQAFTLKADSTACAFDLTPDSSDHNIAVEENTEYFISAYVKLVNTGSPLTDSNFVLTTQCVDIDGVITGWHGATHSLALGQTARVWSKITTSAGAVALWVRLNNKAYSGVGTAVITADRIMLEKVQPGQAEPSEWVPGLVSAAAQQKMRVDAGLALASYTLKFDVDGRVSGWGAVADENGTSFEFLMDSTSWIDASSGKLVMGLYNGSVIIDGAYIKTGTIGSAAIGTAAVTSLKVADGAIISAKIADAAINSAKIAAQIQSDNYSAANNTGWIIYKSGTAVFNQVTVRGTVYATDGEFTGTVKAATIESSLFKLDSLRILTDYGTKAPLSISDVVNFTGNSGSVTLAFTQLKSPSKGTGYSKYRLVSHDTPVSIIVVVGASYNYSYAYIDVSYDAGATWTTIDSGSSHLQYGGALTRAHTFTPATTWDTLDIRVRAKNSSGLVNSVGAQLLVINGT